MLAVRDINRCKSLIGELRPGKPVQFLFLFKNENLCLPRVQNSVGAEVSLGIPVVVCSRLPKSQIGMQRRGNPVDLSQSATTSFTEFSHYLHMRNETLVNLHLVTNRQGSRRAQDGLNWSAFRNVLERKHSPNENEDADDENQVLRILSVTDKARPTIGLWTDLLSLPRFYSVMS